MWPFVMSGITLNAKDALGNLFGRDVFERINNVVTIWLIINDFAVNGTIGLRASSFGFGSSIGILLLLIKKQDRVTKL